MGGSQGCLSYLTYFLLLNTLLPISLIVTLELLKLGQGFFMMFDKKMYSEKQDKCCKVSSFSLNEELGMIKHIFSDKTGTLTCNQMEFKFFCTGNKAYGDKSILVNLGLRTKVTYEDRETRYTFNDKEIANDLYRNEAELIYPISINFNEGDIKISTQKEINFLMLKCLALCHECIIERAKDDTIKYIGPSPDDVVLVDSARRQGIQLTSIKSEKMTIDIFSTLTSEHISTHTYTRVCILEFNSDRKRMSVILKEKDTNRYLLFMKGADIAMFKRLSKLNSEKYIKNLKKYVETFSSRGFRTLVMAFKYIEKSDFFE